MQKIHAQTMSGRKTMKKETEMTSRIRNTSNTSKVVTGPRKRKVEKANKVYIWWFCH